MSGKRSPAFGRQRAAADRDAVGEAVALGVGARGRHRLRIGVEADRRAGAESQCREGEDAGAAADVQDARRHRLELLQEIEAAPGRRVQAGPERHARIERDRDLVRSRNVVEPGRHDHDAADALHADVLLPAFGPVRILDRADLQIAERAQAERLEVPERALCRLDLARRVRPVGDMGGHDERRREVGRGGELVVRDREEAASGGSQCRPRRARGSRKRPRSPRHRPRRSARANASAPTAQVKRSRRRSKTDGSSPASVAGSLTSSSSSRSSRSRFESFVGTTTLRITWRSPRPAPRSRGTPLPRRRISRPACEPAGISISSVPSTVGHRQIRAERGLRERDRQLVVELRPAPDELRVRAHVDRDVQVAVRSAARPGLALPLERDALTGIDPCRDRDLERALLPDPSLAARTRCTAWR